MQDVAYIKMHIRPWFCSNRWPQYFLPWCTVLWSACCFPCQAQEAQRFKAHDYRTTAIAVSPDGKYVVSGAIKGIVHVWDVSGKKTKFSLPFEGRYVTGIAFPKKGVMTTVSHYVRRPVGGPLVTLWDFATGKKLKSYAHPPGLAVGFSPSGKYLVYQAWENKPQVGKQLVIRFAKPFANSIVFKLHFSEKSEFATTAFSPDGRLLAVGYGKGMVELWDVMKKKKLTTFRAGDTKIAALAIAPDNKRLATGMSLGPTKIWEWKSAKLLRSWKGMGSNPLLFTPDSRFLILGGSGNLWVCDWQMQKVVTLLRGHQGATRVLDLSPNGRLLVVGTAGGTVACWETPNGKNYKPFVDDS